MSYLIVAGISAVVGYFWRGLMDRAKKSELNVTDIIDKVIDKWVNHD